LAEYFACYWRIPLVGTGEKSDCLELPDLKDEKKINNITAE